MTRYRIEFSGEVEIDADCELEAQCEAAAMCSLDNCRVVSSDEASAPQEPEEGKC